MLCPACSNRASVIVTNQREDDVVRRYKCACGTRFTGLETILSGSISNGPRAPGHITRAVPWSKRQMESARASGKRLAELNKRLWTPTPPGRPAEKVEALATIEKAKESE